MRFLQTMYKNTGSRFRVNGSVSNDFVVQIGHQRSV